MSRDRVGLSFHESFALNLPAIRAVLALSRERDGEITSKAIRDQTALGPNYVKSMPQYARACGLMEIGNYKLTPFGDLVSRDDPQLQNHNTLWLMHYHISAPQGPGPAFWSHLVGGFLTFGEEVGRNEIVEEIAGFDQRQRDKALQLRTERTAATVFLGTYTKSDGLGPLGLLETFGERDTYVRVSESQSPPLGATACALGDYWAAHFGEQLTVSLGELAKDGGFARVMWMDHLCLDEVLSSLNRMNIVDLYRVAPPFQVARRWTNQDELLARLYR